MHSQTKASVLDACRRFLRPLARLLIRYGVGYREFAEVCKECFVGVATEDFGIRGRPTNLSRVTILTGVSRKSVKRIRLAHQRAGDTAESFGLTPASLVLRAWYSDPRFLAADGSPLELPFEGGSPSLADLVLLHAGDVPSGALVNELLRLGLVESAGNARVRPLSPYFMPPNSDGQLFAAGTYSITNLVSTIAYNTNPQHAGAPLFERYAWSSQLPEASKQALHRLVSDQGEALLATVNRWMREHEVAGDETVKQPARGDVGVGIYYFDQSK
jgi:Family of unknown function (DUF6502)